MTEFRTTEQIAADFSRMATSHRLGPFTQVTNRDHLSLLLTDDPIFEQALHVSGAGPVFYDLGVLSGPEWEGVRQFLDSRLVSATARGELEQLRQDLQAADADGDHLLNNQEIVRFAQSHDRWFNVAQFRSAADLLLNRLPGYLAQPNLNQEQLTRLYGIMNLLASQYDEQGVPAEERGTVYGLSLQGFPSQDANNPPDLIRRARDGRLTTEEIAAVHHVLEAEITDGTWQFRNGAPLRPEELRVLGPMLELAARDGQTLHGMRLVTGEAETRLFAEGDEAARRCLEGIGGALRGSDAARTQQAFQSCVTEMSQFEGRNPDSLGVSTLIARARTGQLSRAETALLRSWMDSHGALYHMARTLSNLVSDPIHLIARNGAFFGGSWLYRRLFLRNAFENRLNKACGGSVDNPGAAYRQYESWLTSRMASAPRWQRFLNYWARGSHTGGRFRQFFANFPVTFLHLAAFNVAAGFKDTNSLPVDIATDLLFLVPLFKGFETYDAFNRSGIQNFVQAQPGVCRSEPATAEAPAVVPATAAEPETAAETQAQMSFMPDYSEMVCRVPQDAPTFETARAPGNTMALPDVARGILAFQGQSPASGTASVRAPGRASGTSGVTAPGFTPAPIIPAPVPIPAPAVVPAPVVVPRFIPVAP